MDIKTHASDKTLSSNSIGKFLRFFIPSMLGLFIFVFPIPYIDGKFVSYADGFTIPIAVLKDIIQGYLHDFLPLLVVISIMTTLVGSLYTKIFKPDFIVNNRFLNNLLNVKTSWLMLRILGAFFAVATYFQYGSEMIYSDSIGGLVLYELMPILFIVFFLAGLLLPLLLDFGLLEFVGVLLSKVMRPLFGLPGRSSVDCLASWLGDGTIGVLLTDKQLQSGFYTKREAAIIATSFSAVSVTFCLVVISQVKLESYFLNMIGVVALCGIVCALVVPKLFPLSRIADTYIVDNNDANSEAIPEGKKLFNHSLDMAVEKAEKSPSVGTFLSDGLKNILDMWIGILPVVMAIGTLGLIVAEKTPVFDYLGMPFIPFLELLNIPFAQEMSKTIMVGFADMFLPAIIGSSIESELTRFVIACLSVSQLIYMSEVGGLILGTKIPVSFFQLLIIFLLRTLISLPIIALCAHMIF
ncbi:MULTISPECIES: YjiH family protein [unclassified Psychrobacter]|uniref:YjiH family protein n=1 Tax=unclassified Psychrobacter TaxID=196806 RepID=UPI0018F494A1|nr:MULTISPECIES: YjiH family protein [unclassified Psychrobacter]